MSSDATQQPDSKKCSDTDGDGDDVPYSDASSSYWPEGWNWARFADPSGYRTLLSEVSKDEFVRLFEGFEDVLGKEGMREMCKYTAQIHEKKLQEERGSSIPPYKAPRFLEEYRRKFPNRDHPWGFVAFRTVLYDNEARWVDFKARLQRILNLAFDEEVKRYKGHEYEDIAIGRKLFTLHWIEDNELDGAIEDTLREWYKKMKLEKEVPIGMDYSLFLSTCPEAVDSVFADPLPTIDSSFWRDDAPFLLVVMELAEGDLPTDQYDSDNPYDPDDRLCENNWFKSVFKVAVEIIPNCFWEEVEMGVTMGTPLTRLTSKVKGCNQLLGGPVPRGVLRDNLRELWWTSSPSPQERKRKLKMIDELPPGSVIIYPRHGEK
ncbi:hypothetical protein MGYG_05323 [Nannizzia gypsea CBS 118893]|uniref:Uncharacterized protein n=1 Tax=Arthroderma gypseum (strain ATCC MYA-4604 / CBS 118893) TaxID=535722 RepID=E4UVJ9_ARTGP|nr:hypothetical protein MGYG_05323 [Nannizzia gypsea CBS 118893]EFR02326.1 hypothetical protein MGYG_05323 [Nannizzia gypsea CBS 118893]